MEGDKRQMKTSRTKASIIIMIIAGIIGYFLGAVLGDEAMSGAILASLIAGIACIIYTIDNRDE